MAKLGSRLTGSQEIRSSNLLGSTNFNGLRLYERASNRFALPVSAGIKVNIEQFQIYIEVNVNLIIIPNLDAVN